MMQQADPLPSVIVVGAGPVGLLTAFILARRQIYTLVVEQFSTIDDKTRALLYGIPAVKVLKKAGLIDEVRSAGYTPGRCTWRKLGGEALTGLDNDVPEEEQDRMVVLPVNDLIGILYQRLLEVEFATVSFGQRVVDIGQDDSNAWIDVEGPEGNQRLKAAYIVGCDGGRSIIRRKLFDEQFPGIQWDVQMVATNVRYPFDAHGYTDANFIIDREHGHMCARINKGGLWRVTYIEEPNLTMEECVSRLPAKFQKILPGNPNPSQFRVEHMSPYRIHQRAAPSFRVGRFLLAGDAAHLCNPFGGLGLTGGIIDAGSVADCLFGVLTGRADTDLLDKYAEVRRNAFLEHVDPYSTRNLKRVMSYDDPEKALQEDEFLKLCKAAEVDENLGNMLKLGANRMYYDLSQHFQK